LSKVVYFNLPRLHLARNYTKVALPLIPHVLSVLIWPSGRLHRSRQTRAETLQHLGWDSSALGATQFGT